MDREDSHAGVDMRLMAMLQPFSSRGQGHKWPQGCERKVRREQAVGWQDNAHA